MIKKHPVLDHPIIGYFILLIFVMFFSSIGSSLIDKPLTKVIPGYGKEVSVLGFNVTYASGIGAAIFNGYSIYTLVQACIQRCSWLERLFVGYCGYASFPYCRLRRCRY